MYSALCFSLLARPHLLGLRPQPPDKLVQTDDVVPVIVELAREQEVGNLDAARLAQRQELVLSHERLERGRVVHLQATAKSEGLATAARDERSELQRRRCHETPSLPM